jgi:hypothetical protein
MQSGRRLPTFLGILLPPPSGSKVKTSVNIHQITRRHVSENVTLHSDRHENQISLSILHVNSPTCAVAPPSVRLQHCTQILSSRENESQDLGIPGALTHEYVKVR